MAGDSHGHWSIAVSWAMNSLLLHQHQLCQVQAGKTIDACFLCFSWALLSSLFLVSLLMSAGVLAHCRQSVGGMLAGHPELL